METSTTSRKKRVRYEAVPSDIDHPNLERASTAAAGASPRPASKGPPPTPSPSFEQPVRPSETTEYVAPDPVLVFDFGVADGPVMDSQPGPRSWGQSSAVAQQYSHEVSDSAPGPSSGTLVISDTGASKYFGHTAGSEWLKDVRVQVVLSLIAIQ